MSRDISRRCFAGIFSKPSIEPRLHPIPDIAEIAADRCCPHGSSCQAFVAVQQQANARGVDWIPDHIHKPFNVLRRAQANRHVENLFGQLDGAFHLGAAARDDDAGGDEFFESRSP